MADELSEAKLLARLLLAAYPNDAKKIVAAFITDAGERDDVSRAALWRGVLVEIETRRCG